MGKRVTEQEKYGQSPETDDQQRLIDREPLTTKEKILFGAAIIGTVVFWTLVAFLCWKYWIIGIVT